MNATERLVEQYFRLCHNCYTVSDLKLDIGGEGRQLDLLVLHPGEAPDYKRTYLHIEVHVTHTRLSWDLGDKDSITETGRKFFGKFRVGRASKTLPDIKAAIEKAYARFGIDPYKVQRVWCVWEFNLVDLPTWQCQVGAEHGLSPELFRVLSFRDEVLPALSSKVGTSDYDDQLVRLVSLIEMKAKHERKLANEARIAEIKANHEAEVAAWIAAGGIKSRRKSPKRAPIKIKGGALSNPYSFAVLPPPVKCPPSAPSSST